MSRVHPDDSPRILRAYERLFEEGRLSSEYRFRKKDGSYCWVSDELQRAARRGRRSGRGGRRLERHHRPQAARRGAGRRAGPARASPVLGTGGDLQLQGERRFRADLRQREHQGLAGLRARRVSRESRFLAALRASRRVAGRRGPGGAPVPEGPPHRRIPVPAQGRQLLLGQRRAAPDPRQGRPAGRGGRLLERRHRPQRGRDRLPPQRAAADRRDRIDLGRLLAL